MSVEAPPTFPRNTSDIFWSHDLTPADRHLLESVAADYKDAPKSSLHLLEDGHMQNLPTGKVLSMYADMHALPSKLRPFVNIAAIQQISDAITDMTAGKAEAGNKGTTQDDEPIDEDLNEQVNLFRAALDDVYSRLSKSLKQDSVARQGEARRSLLDLARDPSVGWESVTNAVWPMLQEFRTGKFEPKTTSKTGRVSSAAVDRHAYGLHHLAGLTANGQSTFPFWDETHKRRRALAPVYKGAAFSSLEPSATDSATISTARKTIKSLRDAALQLMSCEDDERFAKTIQGANRAANEITKALGFPTQLGEQMCNAAHLDTAFDFLSQPKADLKSQGAELSKAATEFMQVCRAGRKKAGGEQISFVDSLVKGAAKISEDPFDGKAWFDFSMALEGSSKFSVDGGYGTGPKVRLHNRDDKDAHMDAARDHTAEVCSATWSEKIDEVPASLQGMQKDTATQSTALASAISK